MTVQEAFQYFLSPKKSEKSTQQKLPHLKKYKIRYEYRVLCIYCTVIINLYIYIFKYNIAHNLFFN
jgi:hypothetical protein